MSKAQIRNRILTIIAKLEELQRLSREHKFHIPNVENLMQELIAAYGELA